MKKNLATYIIVFSIIFLNHNAFGQTIQPTFITNLDNDIKESSGIIIINDRLITHNDSGNGAYLYEVDTSNGSVKRKTNILNSNNTDWEDICHDNEYIYIGDIGNNDGTRKDLAIYKVPIYDYLSATNDEVTATKIQFSYADQNDFTPNLNNTNFDAEGLVSIDDSLYILTKNHGNYQTYIYPLPKTPGTYITYKKDSLFAGGLITGATYNQETKTILLTGYIPFHAFIIEISLLSTPFSIRSTKKMYLDLKGSYQIESIFQSNNDSYYITAEANSEYPAALYILNGQIVTSLSKNLESDSLHYLYPNPTTHILNIPFKVSCNVDIFSISGNHVLSAKKKSIDVSNLKAGYYIVKVMNDAGEILLIDNLLIR